MAKFTSIKDALARWEEKNEGQSVKEATIVNLYFQWPPINKMDNSLAILSQCTKLSLSTNMIDKITGVGTLKNLKVLSVGRNQIRNFSGLEALGDTLQELWMSYNMIEKLKGVNIMKALKVLYLAHNQIRDWGEVNKLAECPKLEELVFVGNPFQESTDEQTYQKEIKRRLLQLKKIDGDTIIREEAK